MIKKLFVVLFLFANLVNADIIFSEVMYNPSGTDSGREWIEFYNNGSSVSIEGWKLYEAGTNHGLSVYQGDYGINAGEFFIIVDQPEDFLLYHPDYNGNLFDSVYSLSNTGEYLALKNSSLLLIDELNYSDTVEEGYSLFNFNLSGNWNQSLIEGGTPGYYETIDYGEYEENLISEVEINNAPPEIIYFHVYPDEDMLEGVQVFPGIDGKNITVNAMISDNNSDDLNINLDFEKEAYLVGFEIINSSYFNYTWNIFMESYDEAKFYNLVLNADDGINYVNESFSFEYMGLMYMDFSKDSLYFGNVNPGEISGINNLKVFNKGNVDISLGVSGGDLSCDDWSMPVSSIETFFNVLGQWKSLVTDFLDYNDTLLHGFNSSKSLDFRLNAPVGIKASNYSGVINLIGG